MRWPLNINQRIRARVQCLPVLHAEGIGIRGIGAPICCRRQLQATMCNDAPVSRMDALSRIKSFLDNLCGDAESVA